MTKNVDTAPDGFYAVCAMGRGVVPGFFWAAWWSASGLAVSPAPAPRTWPQVLELSSPCTAADVRRAYRRLALKRHPDRGGTDAEFNALTKAYDAALLEVEATRA